MIKMCDVIFIAKPVRSPIEEQVILFLVYMLATFPVFKRRFS